MDAKHPPQQNQLVDVHMESISPSVDTAMDDFTDADRVAVQGTNVGLVSCTIFGEMLTDAGRFYDVERST